MRSERSSERYERSSERSYERYERSRVRHNRRGVFVTDRQTDGRIFGILESLSRLKIQFIQEESSKIRMIDCDYK